MSRSSPARDPAAVSAPDRRLLRRSLEFVRPHVWTVFGVLALALVLSSLSAVDPLIMKFLFDLLGSGGDLRLFAIAMGALLVAELGRSLLTAWLGTSSWDLRLKVEYALRERVTAKLNALPIAYHQREGVGGLINRVNQAVMSFVAAFSELSFNVLPVVLYLGLSLAAMCRLEWQLTIAVIIFAPLPAVIGARAAPEQTQRERRLVERWSSIYSRFNEVLTGIATVKSFAMEEAEGKASTSSATESGSTIGTVRSAH
jgi:ATP-binding cassette subfamily B protein